MKHFPKKIFGCCSGISGCLLLSLVLAGSLVPSAAQAQIVVPANCDLDVQGADDEPGQKDLNQACEEFGDFLPFDRHVSWNWDNTQWSGNNTGDACALYDTQGVGGDGDDYANFAVCVTIGANGQDPATQVVGRLAP